jgi:hypothetical protein
MPKSAVALTLLFHLVLTLTEELYLHAHTRLHGTVLN